MGVRIEGTPVVCDAPRTAGALAFISHAAVVSARVGKSRPVTAAQVLLTQTCANLLEAGGHPLGSRGLVAAYGRPFAMGMLRVELFPSGVAPGSASLLCEGPHGRVVFAGPVGLSTPGSHTQAAEIRPAHALCLDATFAATASPFTSVAETLERVLAFVEATLSEGHQPVLRTGVDALTLDLGQALHAAGFGARAHTSLLKLAATHAAAGWPTVPWRPFSGSLGAKEVLLFPAATKTTAAVERLPAAKVAITAPLAHGALGEATHLPLSNRACEAELLSYVKATGAKEVATLNDLEGRFAARLRAQGTQAYALGPPSQMPLFAR